MRADDPINRAPYERLRRPFVFWWLWVIANTIGIACGWAIGETVGQVVRESVNATLGVGVAWIIFEVILWMMRSTVLLSVRGFSVWRPIDTIIWLGAEFFGEILSEGMLEISGPVWLTAGAVWGATWGAGIWLTLWLVIQPKRTMKWRVSLATVWGFFGLVGGSFLSALALVTSQEVGKIVGATIHPIVGWGASGALIGCFIGSITGLAFVRLLRWQMYPVVSA